MTAVVSSAHHKAREYHTRRHDCDSELCVADREAVSGMQQQEPNMAGCVRRGYDEGGEKQSAKRIDVRFEVSSRVGAWQAAGRKQAL